MEAKTCLYCEKDFISTMNGHGGTRYCSRTCAFKAKELPPKPCLFCKKEFKPKKATQQYCSIICSNHATAEDYNVVCLFCSKIFKAARANKRKYCSSKCSNLIKEEKLIDRTISTGIFQSTHSSTARKIAFALFGKTCIICKLAAWLGKEIPLVLDHIDGNSDNWEVTNLRLICPNCDAQTDTYKGRNKGKGRFARRKRYAEGKSY